MRSERELIAAIRQRSAAGKGAGAAGLVRGIGDDCAVYRPTAGLVSLVTTDTLVEGVHFDRSWHPARLLGRKAVAVNLSDIAAMGGVPRWLFLSLALPSRTDEGWPEEFLAGLVQATEAAGAALIGGDTVASGREIMISVTVIGEAVENQVCFRSGGRVADSLWVGGSLGQAAAGLEICRLAAAARINAPPLGPDAYPTGEQPLVKAHLDPEAQVLLGQRLAASGLIHAMMDISDGLATDLAHLCAESGLGAEVAAEALPLTAELREAARCYDGDPLAWALKGGEDYRLLFAAAPENDEAIRALAANLEGVELHRIGRLRPQPGVVLRQGEEETEIGYSGYDHFAARPPRYPAGRSGKEDAGGHGGGRHSAGSSSVAGSPRDRLSGGG